MSVDTTSTPAVENDVVLQYKGCWRELSAKFIKPQKTAPQCLEEIEGGVAFSHYIKDMAQGLVRLISS